MGRDLLYVPIIHSESDLGSLGPEITRKSASLCGEKRWAEHKETVVRFWDSVANYLISLDPATLTIYQDGLAADGELGKRIIEEAARRGSINHQLILQLMNKGGRIRKTEDASLLLEELRLAYQESASEKTSYNHRIGFNKTHLTEKRDRFMAKIIDETLRQGETGLLFIGAYHNVHFYLPDDIVVIQLKGQNKVEAYFKELISGARGARFKQLVRYLTSPVILT